MYRFPAFAALVPEEVKIQLSLALVQAPELGYSILELGHRSIAFELILAQAIELTREMLKVPEHFEILFLQGGASFGFALSAYNMLGKYKKAAFLETDLWSTKAMQTARTILCQQQAEYPCIEILASSKENGFSYIPKEYNTPKDVDYIHFTSNNTVAGTQFINFPKGNPLVSDMTSDVFTRSIDFSNIGLIYAGLQKSLCAGGLGLYIIDKKYLKSRPDVPQVFNLQAYQKAQGIYHTPNIFGIYTALLMLRWMQQKGGIDYFQAQNKKKAAVVYHALENNAAFVLHAKKEDRSMVTLTFLLADDQKKPEFETYLAQNNIADIQGHRSFGAYRISLYNTISFEEAEILAKVLKGYNKILNT
jgi:phosphoserine aminotransferase